MAVSGSDVYIVGHIERQAMYWKNGVRHNLTTENDRAEANAIALSGSDVYIAGFELGSNENFAVYWKNGVKNLLPNAPVPSNATWAPSANAIAVAGGIIHIAGESNDSATYWKNGVRTALWEGSADAIAVSGSDVYIGGSEGGKAVLWKNGVKTVLASEGAGVTRVTLAGTDVFVTGYENSNTAVLWKNEVKTVLSIPATYVHGLGHGRSRKRHRCVRSRLCR